MKVIITETGTEETLSAILARTGCDYTEDLIGNAGAFSDGQFEQIEDTGVYRCDQRTYDWWAAVIEDYNAASVAVEEAKALGVWTDDVAAAYLYMECNDMDTHAAFCRQFVENLVSDLGGDYVN